MSAGDLGELLDEIPSNDVHLGAFAGQRAGRRTRGLVWLVGMLTLACALGAWLWTVRVQRERVLHPFTLSPPTQSPVREIVWSDGFARLGLGRPGEGVERIVLPDRILILDPQSDHAQVAVEVRDGATVSVKTITGKVQMLPREATNSIH